jgi:hypothetical protein
MSSFQVMLAGEGTTRVLDDKEVVVVVRGRPTKENRLMGLNPSEDSVDTST